VASQDGGPGVPDGGVPAAPPTCYRHAGRETYVACSRCARPICPDCMISASVGFQCPECVSAGNKDVREARTTFGGRLTGNVGAVTTTLIVLNVLVYIAVQAEPGALLERFVLRAYNFGDGPGVAQGGYYRLFSAAFLHQQTLHIFFNMIMLWMFGRPLEEMLGRARFLAVYLICALGGSTASYMFNDPNVGSLGASGAVIGMVGALLVLERRLRHNTAGVAIYLAILLLPGLLLPGIDWRAHVGGLITGAVLGAAFAYAPRARRNLYQAGTAIALVVILAAAVAYRTNDLNGQFGSFGF
jgi:membrane associated rhomboid family serine protease